MRKGGVLRWRVFSSCTGSGACPKYYGDASFVAQEVVDRMLANGLRRLTGTKTIAAAWAALLHEYKSGEIVAIKVNFNDTIFGGGTVGYLDNDAYVDALPQVESCDSGHCCLVRLDGQPCLGEPAAIFMAIVHGRLQRGRVQTSEVEA